MEGIGVGNGKGMVSGMENVMGKWVVVDCKFDVGKGRIVWIKGHCMVVGDNAYKMSSSMYGLFVDECWGKFGLLGSDIEGIEGIGSNGEYVK